MNYKYKDVALRIMSMVEGNRGCPLLARHKCVLMNAFKAAAMLCIRLHQKRLCTLLSFTML